MAITHNGISTNPGYTSTKQEQRCKAVAKNVPAYYYRNVTYNPSNYTATASTSCGGFSTVTAATEGGGASAGA